MYSGQDINSGLQPAMPQVPITSGNGPIILAPTEKKPKRWLIVTGVILFLVAIGTGVAALVLTKSKPVVADVTKAYIEYFVYGTEGENQVNDATFEMNSDDFAIKKKLESESSEESSEYFDKLSNKYSMLESTGKEVFNADLLTYNGIYLDFYKAISQAMNSDFLIKSFNNGVSAQDLYQDLSTGEGNFLKIVYITLTNYSDNWYKFYTEVQGWSCMDDNEINYNCIWGIGEEDNIYWGDAMMDENLGQYNETIYSILAENLKKFYEQGVVNG